jgi:hypothetical protein
MYLPNLVLKHAMRSYINTLFAIQCEDDVLPLFQTLYTVQNNSSLDLYYINPDTEFLLIPNQSKFIVASDLNQDNAAISPEASDQLETLKLYELIEGNYVLYYEQDPIDNALWDVGEPTVDNFKFTLTLEEIVID